MKNLNGKKRRVVVTGLGVVSSIGIGWQNFWKNLLAGKNGISKVEAFDVSKHSRQFAGEVKNFDPTKYMTKKRSEKYGRASQMGIVAAQLALKDSGIELTDEVKSRMLVSVGTTTGEIGILEEYGNAKYLNEEDMFRDGNLAAYPAGSINSAISIENGLENTSNMFATACAAGNYALGYVYDLIQSGKADYGLAGGVDGFSRIVFTGFGRLYAVAPEKCQPFDKKRKGMIPAEGAGILFLETLESAKKRKAKIYAEMLSYGLSCDSYHMTKPTSRGVAKALIRALDNSGVSIADVDYISAHGTGTLENDKAECEAIYQVFGKKTNAIPISSIKSMLGHTMGAASSLESIACCLAIQNNVIPPTINHEEDDPDCSIDCVPNKSRKHKVNIALNNSQAFGGNNACLVFGS